MPTDLPGEGYTSHNRARLLRGGQPYFDTLLQCIAGARETIHLQVYIFEKDETGNRVWEALVAAAARGVQVFVLLDGYGSQHVPAHMIQQFKAAGGRFRWFEPLLRARNFYFGRRLHHKVAVFDAQAALVGGVNISNRYNDLPHYHAWLDWAVFTEGEAAYELYGICLDLYNKAGWGKKKFRRYHPPRQLLAVEESIPVRIRREDWVRSRNEISASYLKVLAAARREVILLSSYFLPGPQMRRALTRAAARGVVIKVIAAGKSDVAIAKQAERYLYRWLLQSNVLLYEYQASVLHGKISTADGIWTTVGSYNINFISAFASIELNLELLDSDFAEGLRGQLQEVIEKDCIPITTETWLAKDNLWKKMIQRISYETVRLLFFLFTFYFRQQKQQRRRAKAEGHKNDGARQAP